MSMELSKVVFKILELRFFNSFSFFSRLRSHPSPLVRYNTGHMYCTVIHVQPRLWSKTRIWNFVQPVLFNLVGDAIILQRKQIISCIDLQVQLSNRFLCCLNVFKAIIDASICFLCHFCFRGCDNSIKNVKILKSINILYWLRMRINAAVLKMQVLLLKKIILWNRVSKINKINAV